jgi:hypothetical protein
LTDGFNSGWTRKKDSSKIILILFESTKYLGVACNNCFLQRFLVQTFERLHLFTVEKIYDGGWALCGWLSYILMNVVYLFHGPLRFLRRVFLYFGKGCPNQRAQDSGIDRILGLRNQKRADNNKSNFVTSKILSW